MEENELPTVPVNEADVQAIKEKCSSNENPIVFSTPFAVDTLASPSNIPPRVVTPVSTNEKGCLQSIVDGRHGSSVPCASCGEAGSEVACAECCGMYHKVCFAPGKSTAQTCSACMIQKTSEGCNNYTSTTGASSDSVTSASPLMIASSVVSEEVEPAEDMNRGHLHFWRAMSDVANNDANFHELFKCDTTDERARELAGELIEATIGSLRVDGKKEDTHYCTPSVDIVLAQLKPANKDLVLHSWLTSEWERNAKKTVKQLKQNEKLQWNKGKKYSTIRYPRELQKRIESVLHAASGQDLTKATEIIKQLLKNNPVLSGAVLSECDGFLKDETKHELMLKIAKDLGCVNEEIVNGFIALKADLHTNGTRHKPEQEIVDAINLGALYCANQRIRPKIKKVLNISAAAARKALAKKEEMMPSISEDGVRDIFARWSDALEKDDPEGLAACYNDGVVLPSGTDFIGVEDYFREFLKLKPTNIRVVDKESENITIGHGWCSYEGVCEVS